MEIGYLNKTYKNNSLKFLNKTKLKPKMIPKHINFKDIKKKKEGKKILILTLI